MQLNCKVIKKWQPLLHFYITPTFSGLFPLSSKIFGTPAGDSIFGRSNGKGLQSDKLSGDGQIFQVWPYFNSLIITKLPFSQQKHVQIFPLPSPSKTCALHFDSTLEKDPKNIFYYQRDVENYTDQVLNFLLFDRHEYIHTESSGL